ncbi:Nucleolar Complex 2 protein [Knufia obscura]|uniref:Nucleolar Complex 2 protein n=2 Tax=Knufia TaxID=430999 RepID=A0AAN8I264_9EURO|nr:Nucleolar Complex 2 protein [Knufia obscura]KAK5948019.1 Nucleolar Complex 2 protein [Knufia fluminis]
MGKQAKATKKFEKNRLKDTIDNRKSFAKIKQRHQKTDKRRSRNEKNAAKDESEEEDEEVDDREDVNQDDFFQEALPLPTTKQDKAQPNGKRKHDELDEVEVDGVDDEDDELDMAALAQKDPEFHKYLQENDPELLDFNEDDDLEELEVSEDERPNKKRKTAKDPFETNVSVEMVRKWKQAMQEQHSIRSLRETVLAFRSAVHMDEESKDFKYTIPSSDVYHEILVTALKEAPKVLAHHLPVKEGKGGRITVPTNSSQFKKLSPLIRTFSTSINHFLPNLTEPATIRMTLQSFEPLLPYLLQFRKFLKQIIKSVASIWSDNTTDEATRITAFLILRRLLTIGDAGIKEAVLKASYEQLVKSARNTSTHTIAGINLMKNSAAELWGIDQKVSYTTAFGFIRQAAMHLRTNITKPTKESYKTIYNWQFVHSLDFWSRVLSMHCNSLLEAEKGKQSELRPLIYPVVQITLGVMRLIPTSTYFPLRFQLIRSLLRISQSTGTYIPLAAAMLEVLNSTEMKKPAKNAAANLKPLDFETNIRAPSSYLKTRVYQDGLGEQIVELFSEFFVLWCKNIAYPELQVPVTVMLKRWLKSASKASTGNKNGKLNQSLLLLVQKSEANSKWIVERRNKVTFTPRDRAEVENFLKDVKWEDTPMGAFVMGQRGLRESRLRVVTQGREEEEKRRRSKKEEDDDEEIEVV